MHAETMSQRCTAEEEEINERVQEQYLFHQVCGKDVASFCKDADPANEGIWDV